jgi:hypothetical protein
MPSFLIKSSYCLPEKNLLRNLLRAALLLCRNRRSSKSSQRVVAAESS